MNGQTATIGEIFSLSWQQYKQRALPILAVILISAALLGGLIMIMVLCAVFGGALLGHFMNDQAGLLIVVGMVCALVLIATVVAIWCQAAMLVIVMDEELGIVEAFQKGWDYLWPMAWVMTILSGILIAGFVLGVLPGILTLVWFCFCFYTLIAEDRRGLEALLASMEYVKGHWWNTFGKLLVIWLLSAVISLVPFVGQVLSMLFAPFFMLFMLAMYRDLRSIKGEAAVTDNSGIRIFWWIVTVVGLLLPLLGLAAGMFALFTGDLEWMEYTRDSMHGTWL